MMHQKYKTASSSSTCNYSDAADDEVMREPAKSSMIPEWIKKPCVVHWLADFNPLEQVELYETFVGMLRQQYFSLNGYNYRYEDWEELMRTDRYVFQELCWEFHSTYKLKENPEGMKDEEFMRFSLGGVEYSMCLYDFTRCLKIYSEKQMDEEHFSDYIWSGACVSEMNDIEVFDPKKVWKEFSKSATSSWPNNGDGKVSAKDMDVVEHRLIHLFLTHIIFHRSEDTDKVSLSDLWYLKQITSKNHVNIPYCVAYYLKHFAGASGGQSPICGGHFVTLIAHHLGVIDDKSGGVIQKKPAFRVNPMITYQEYLDAHVLFNSADYGICVYKPGLKEEILTDFMLYGWWSSPPVAPSRQVDDSPHMMID